MTTEYLGARATFSLPDWFGERQERMIRHFFPKGHVFEGSFSGTTNKNTAHDAMYRLRGVKTLCTHPQGKWVEVEFICPPKLLPRAIRKFEGKLTRLLNRYREAHK
jgi:hypothetical protein